MTFPPLHIAAVKIPPLEITVNGNYTMVQNRKGLDEVKQLDF